MTVAGQAPCISDQGEQGLQQCLEYNYLTAITIRLFEDTAIDGPVCASSLFRAANSAESMPHRFRRTIHRASLWKFVSVLA